MRGERVARSMWTCVQQVSPSLALTRRRLSSPVRDGRVGPVVISFLPPVPRRPVEEMGDSVDDAGRVNRLLLVFFHS